MADWRDSIAWEDPEQPVSPGNDKKWLNDVSWEDDGYAGPSMSAAPPNRSFTEFMSDQRHALGAGVASAVGGLAQLPVDTYNAAVQYSPLRMALDKISPQKGAAVQNALTAEQPGFVRSIADWASETADDQRSRMSLGQQLQAEAFAETEGFIPSAKYLLTNPAFTVTQGTEMTGQIIPGGVGAKGLGALSRGLRGAKAQTGANVTLQSGMAGSMAQDQVEQALEAMPVSELRKHEDFDRLKLMLETDDDEVAKDWLIRNNSTNAFAQSFLVNLGTSLMVPGGTTIESAMLGNAGRAGTSRFRNMMLGGAGEAVSEGIAESGEQISQNVNTYQPWSEGVGQAGALGSILGAGMGAGAGFAQRPSPLRDGDDLLSGGNSLDATGEAIAQQRQPGADRIGAMTDNLIQQFGSDVPAEPAGNMTNALRAQQIAQLEADIDAAQTPEEMEAAEAALAQFQQEIAEQDQMADDEVIAEIRELLATGENTEQEAAQAVAQLPNSTVGTVEQEVPPKRQWRNKIGPDGKPAKDSRGRPIKQPVVDYRTDNLLHWLSAAGGVNFEEVRAQGGADPALMKDPAVARPFGRIGMPAMRRNGGLTLDQVRGMMQEDGWLPADDPNNPSAVSDNDALDLIMEAINGRTVFHPYEGADARMADAARTHAEQEEMSAAQHADGLLDEATNEDAVADWEDDFAPFAETLGREAVDTDVGEAYTVVELANMAAELGVDPMDVAEATGAFGDMTEAQRADALWNLIKEQSNGTDRTRIAETRSGSDAPQEAGPAAAVPSQGNRPGEDGGNLGQGESGARGGFQLAGQQPIQPEQVAQPASQGGLFAPPTRGEIMDAEIARRDAERNGQTGTGRTDMMAGDGELFAGPRPAQTDIKDAAAPTRTLDPTTNRPPASWVIRNKETGEVVMETFDRKKVDALNTAKYEAVPIGEHLSKINSPDPTLEAAKAAADQERKQEAPKPASRVTPQVASETQLASLIAIAADSVEKLRTSDVDRVLREAPAQFRLALAEHIKAKRRDLASEVDEVMAEQGAPSADSNVDDWLGEFFTPEAEADMQERRRADEDRRKAIVATLRAEADQARATAADWAGRKYTGNNKTIHFDGDGPGREFQSVGGINEARRQRVVQERNEAAAAIDALADRIERGDDADIRAHIEEANTSKNLRDEAARDMFAGRPFGGGDTSGAKSVGGILRAAYAATSTSGNRAGERAAGYGAAPGEAGGTGAVREGEGSARQGQPESLTLSSPASAPAASNTPAPSQSGLFAPPTRGEVLDAEIARRDAERNGQTGTGRTDMLSGDGELFAGPRPEQAEIQNAEQARTPPEGPYTADLFGSPLPDSGGTDRANGPARSRVRGDVQPASPVLGDTPTPAGEYTVRTVVGTETRRKLGASRIRSFADLAQATQYLYRSAVERFDGIVTDANGKPLAVVGGFKGELDSATIPPPVLIAEIVRVPGAAQVWFSHNHPSGQSELSRPDRVLADNLKSVLRGSGIESMGLIAVGDGEYTATDGSGGKVPAAESGVTVPVVEREQVRDNVERESITSPASAKVIGKAAYDRAGVPGILLMDTRNAVTGWMPIPDAMLGDLRGTGQLNAIYRSVSEGNVAAAILVHAGELDAGHPSSRTVNISQNIAAALRNAGVRPLDSINVKTMVSRADGGHSIDAGPVFSRRPSPVRRGTPLGAEKNRAVEALAVRIAGVNGVGKKLIVVENRVSDLPAEVRQHMADEEIPAEEVRGVHIGGRTYLVAENLHTVQDVVETLFHEHYGHFGLRAKYGAKLGRELRNLLESIGGLNGLRSLAKEQGIDLSHYEATLAASKSIPNIHKRLILMEELMAHVAETTGTLRRTIEEWVGKVRDWLRTRGFAELAEYGITDLAYVLREARQAAMEKAEGGDARRPFFQRVFHGTPHRGIEQTGFQLNKIGTGEGAQAYGYGMYFASQRGVAEGYRKNLTRGTERYFYDGELAFERDASGAMFDLTDPRTAAIFHVANDGLAGAKKYLAGQGEWGRSAIDALKSLNPKKIRVERNEGQLYHAEIPEDSDLLDWDKPLSEQPEKVRAALRRSIANLEIEGESFWERDLQALDAFAGGNKKVFTGADLYADIIEAIGSRDSRSASEYLNSIGIPGLRYLDGQSRNRPLKDIKREFLAELPEDADFADVVELLGTGAFSPKNEALLQALAADGWLGFDYPSQALSAVLGGQLGNYDPSPALVQAVSDAQDGGTHNYVIWDEALLTPEAAEITPYYSRPERGTGDERNLIIQHNLSAGSLLHADRIGGLAVPSLAVTKVDSPLSGFGEITLLGTSHLADPKGYAKTQVFGADIYSPRYPGITYQLDKNGLKAINRALAPHRNEDESDLYSGGNSSGVEFLTQRKDFKRWADANGVEQGFHAREAAAAELLRDSGAKERLFQGFDYNGNRRYKAHTLENVVRELKKELRGGENYNYGVGSLRAHFTPRFRSIDAIRKAKGALVSKEQMEATKQEIDSEFFGIVDMLRKENPSHTNPFMFTDNVLAVMADAAKKGLHRAAKEYGINVGQDSARAAVEFMEKLRTLPTEYFEAKVLRGVDLAEFAVAVVPKGVDPRVVEKLEKHGVRVAFYKRGDDADRAQVIRQQAESTQDALFSRQESNAAPAFLTSAADVRSAVRQVLDGWKGDKPVVRVVQTADGLPADAKRGDGWQQAEGYWDGGSAVYIVAGNNRDVARALEVLSHEAIGHYGIEKVLGEKKWARLVADVKRLRGLQESDVSSNVRNALQSAKRRYGQESDVVFAKEFIAIMAEQGVRTGLTARVAAAIRQFLAKLGIPVNIGKTFREAELLAALHAGRQRVTQAQRGQQATSGAPAGAFSRQSANFDQPAGYDFNESDYRPSVVSWAKGRFGDQVAANGKPAWQNFTRWFGDSQVVDAEGKPLVVYHGTPNVGFTEFDVSNVGAFLSNRFDVAASYAGRYNDVEFDTEGAYTDDGTDQGVYSAYLSMRNPLVVDWGGKDWGQGPEGLKLDDWANRAKRAGHDGLIVEDVVDAGWLAPGLVDDDGIGRVFVAFRPEQIKSATGNAGTFDPTNPDIRFSEPAPNFYSAMLESVAAAQGLPKAGATAQQWKGWLDGAVRRGEFKQSERDWLGVDAWLDAQDKAVTREQLADFIRANEVQVEDVVLGGSPQKLTLPDEWYFQEADDDGYDGQIGLYDERNELVSTGATEEAALEAGRDLVLRELEYDQETGRSDGGTKFHQGSIRGVNTELPGGENYREFLLTLPTQPVVGQRPDTTGWSVLTVSDPDYVRFTGSREIRVLDAQGDVVLTRGSFSGTDAQAIEQAADSFERSDASDQRDATQYRSSHFEQPNILAHVRFNERTDADGKRVLFIEEIQSDWHQAGRKRGYAGGQAQSLPEGTLAYSPDENGTSVWSVSLPRPVRGRNLFYGATEHEARANALSWVNGGRGAGAVPDAPFKGTDEWAMLAFKRMVRHAAENGFDRIAWTTGEQQAERYDLSKHIDMIEYEPRPDGTYDLSAMRDGSEVIGESRIGLERIEALVGKEIAEKISKGEGATLVKGNGAKIGQLSGLQLKVGGEGMRGFYDAILPKAVNKWAKKFGAKTGRADFGGDVGTTHAIDLTPKMRDAALDGLPMFSRPDSTARNGVEYAHGQEALTSRLASWSSALRLGGSRPRPVESRPESIGAVNRNASGAAEQGDATREEIREQSQRLIERAKADGFFWPDNSPILADLGSLQSLGGAEHQVFLVGKGDSRFVIRATDNGFFGPRSDISPAQYLARLDDYSSTFPSLQTRLIGVSESAEVEGNAVIWTAQPYVRGTTFRTQPELAAAMRAHGWEQVGDDQSFQFRHTETGVVIEDAHTDNVFQDDAGNLYPFDVVVEALPDHARQPASEKPLFSRKQKIPKDWDADQRAAAGNFDGFTPKETLRQRFDRIRERAGERLAQLIFDQFRPLARLDSEAFMTAHLSRGTDGALEALTKHGIPELHGGALSINTKYGGFLSHLSKLGGNAEVQRFLMWVVGNRAERLMAEGRENLFTPEQIAGLKRFSQGDLPGGKKRIDAYRTALRAMNVYNKAVLNIAQQAGLIDPKSRKTWESEFYVPFYRVLDDGKNAYGHGQTGLVRQKVVRRLKGGTERLGDPLENMLANWSSLLGASMRNMAANKALDAAETMGIARKVYAGTKGATWAMRGGKQVHFEVDDPLIVESLEALNFNGYNNPAMRLASKFKRALSFGVTLSPAYRIRNLARDLISAAATAEVSKNPIVNLIQGVKATQSGSDTMIKLMAGGGAIRFGAMNDGAQSENARKLIAMGVKDNQILNTPEKFKNALRRFYDAYQELGDRAETVNRAAIYERAIAAGKSHLEASFEARDLMNFTSMGSSAAIRALAQVLPFFNARLQGVDRLARGARKDPMRFASVTGVVALASALLYLLQSDDDEYKALPDYVRDTYWPVKIGGTWVYLPKPFEVGALGTVVERFTELMFRDLDAIKEGDIGNEDYQLRDFKDTLVSLLTNTLAMNPVPQIVKPAGEAWFNYDMFRQAPIDNMAQQRLLPHDRHTATTSATSVLAGEALGVSPQKIDHMVRGYLGWLGIQALNASDWMVRGATDLPSNPRHDMTQPNNWLVVGEFLKEEGTLPSKYIERFYESQKAIDQIYASASNALRGGDPERAQELLSDPKLRARPMYQNAERQITRVNRQIKAITSDRILSATEKNRKLQELRARRDEIARRVDEMARRFQEAQASP